MTELQPPHYAGQPRVAGPPPFTGTLPGPPVGPSGPVGYPPPGTPGSPWPPRRRRRWPWVVAGLTAIVLLVAGGLAVWWTSRDTGPTHPDKWDSRVTELVHFVEDQRDRTFEHPVTVRFLDESRYRTRITGGDSADPTTEERRSADEGIGEQRALGVLSGDVDPFEASDDLIADGSVAFYDPDTQEVLVKGSKLTVGTRVTLVHELTHALQDQVVGLDRIERAGDSLDRSTAIHTLTEGDASEVESAYLDTLDHDEFDAYTQESDAGSSDAQASLDAGGVPAAWQAGFALPYTFGPAFVRAELDEGGGNGGLWHLYRGHGLRSTLPIADLAVDPDTAVTTVDAPEVGKGRKEISTDTFGPFEWMVPLAEYTDQTTVRTAIAGWRGDSVLVSKNREGVVCVDGVVALTDADAAASFAGAVNRWFAALPPENGATSSTEGTKVRLHTCDPGPKVTVPLTGRADRTLNEIALRNQIAAGASTEAGLEMLDGYCMADGLIAHFGFDRLLDGDPVTDDPSYTLVAVQVARSCGVGPGD